MIESATLSEDPVTGQDGREGRIRAVASTLAESLRQVISQLPGEPQRPNQLARLLGLNRDIAGRVLAAAQADDPIAAAHVIPGPEPLRKVLRAARRKTVDGDLIDKAEEAVRQFEILIRETAGNRPALDAMLMTMLPDARAGFELTARQMLFKGASLVRGAMADMWFHAAFVHPNSDDPAWFDVAYVYGTFGLRRLRPEVSVKFTYRQFGTPTNPWRTLDGHGPDQETGDELDQFCTLPPAKLLLTKTDSGTVYALAGSGVGPKSATDKLLAEVRPRAMARHAAAKPRNKKSLFVAPSVPVKLLVFDVLLHEDVYPGSQPSLVVYDTVVEGMASVNDAARDADRLSMHESITVLGRGGDFSLKEMPGYRNMLRHVLGRLNWNPAKFHGYRCRIQYPMHGSQTCMVFDAPPSP